MCVCCMHDYSYTIQSPLDEDQLPRDAIANVDGDNAYVRVQVLTNAGALGRDKQVALGTRLTELIGAAPGTPPPPDRIWVVLIMHPASSWCWYPRDDQCIGEAG